jgi:sugar phosphate isomerase/epimerase
MPQLTRRDFLRYSSAAAACAAAGTRTAGALSPPDIPLGFQAYEIIEDLNKDWEGTLRQMVSMGYTLIDMLAYNPYTMHPAKKLRADFTRVGLQCRVCHFLHGTWSDTMGMVLDYANALGARHSICGPRKQLATSDDWKAMADELNRFGAAAKKEGQTIAYHNHEIEFVQTPQGDIPWDLLMANTDPAIVSFQIDVGNLTFGGGDAIAYFRKYNDRYFSFHAKDFKPGKAAVPVGSGILDWKEIFKLARQAKVESCIAEVGAYGVRTLDGAPLEKTEFTILESYRRSARFLIDFKG